MIKGVSETIENEGGGLKSGFLVMLLDTLGVRLLGNMLAGKEVIRLGEEVIRAGEDQDF